jgi:mRNA-degrading endonuclease toxin of MazEF toxin-antitoxin module
MSWERGDVVVATDPFRDDESAGRPFLVVSTDETPFHGEQYIAFALTTRTWHDERIPLEGAHWMDGGGPESSSIMPWSVNAVRTEWVNYRQGTLHEDVVDRAVERVVTYLTS